MRYASTYDKTGATVVARGDPLVGLTELGPATTAEVLQAADARHRRRFRRRIGRWYPSPAEVSSASPSTTRRTVETGRSDSEPKFAGGLSPALTSWSSRVAPDRLRGGRGS